MGMGFVLMSWRWRHRGGVVHKLSIGEICVANFKAPCKWCEFGQVFNGQLGHLYKLGDWKTAESWPMLNYWPQSDRVTE